MVQDLLLPGTLSRADIDFVEAGVAAGFPRKVFGYMGVPGGVFYVCHDGEPVDPDSADVATLYEELQRRAAEPRYPPTRIEGATILPSPGQILDLGSSAERWGDVYATSLITLSDANKKVDVEPMSTPSAMELVMNCQAVSYRMKDFDTVTYGEQTHRRRHFGFIAQQVQGVLGESADECGIWCCDDEGNQSLRYEQFIAPLMKVVQAQQQQLEQQQQQISYCLETIQAIQTVLRERPIFE